jgi:hypothetical protein
MDLLYQIHLRIYWQRWLVGCTQQRDNQLYYDLKESRYCCSKIWVTLTTLQETANL